MGVYGSEQLLQLVEISGKYTRGLFLLTYFFLYFSNVKLYFSCTLHVVSLPMAMYL